MDSVKKAFSVTWPHSSDFLRMKSCHLRSDLHFPDLADGDQGVESEAECWGRRSLLPHTPPHPGWGPAECPSSRWSVSGPWEGWPPSGSLGAVGGSRVNHPWASSSSHSEAVAAGDSMDTLTKQQNPVELLPVCFPVEHTSQAPGTRSGASPFTCQGLGPRPRPPAQALWPGTWEQWLCPPQEGCPSQGEQSMAQA